MKRPNAPSLFVALTVLCVLAIALGVVIGSTGASFLALLKLCAPFLPLPEVDATTRTIIVSIRIPRTLTAALVGGSLALAGAMMQGVFKNPMAEPYVIGVSAGGGLGAVIAVALGVTRISTFASPALAFVFAFGVTAVVYLLSLRGGRSESMTLLLAGIAVNSLVGSITYLILFMSLEEWDVGKEALYWFMGTFDGKGYAQVAALVPFVVVGLIGAFFTARPLDIMALGESHANAMGVPVAKYRAILIALAAALTGSSVAIAGMIGFVGLVVPHGARLLFGANHRTLLPASFLSGALFLTLIDVAIRVLTPIVPLRVGIVTGLVGAPFFLFLLLRKRTRAAM